MPYIASTNCTVLYSRLARLFGSITLVLTSSSARPAPSNSHCGLTLSNHVVPLPPLPAARIVSGPSSRVSVSIGLSAHCICDFFALRLRASVRPPPASTPRRRRLRPAQATDAHHRHANAPAPAMLRVRSSRRAVGLKPSDYDHEIDLVNHDVTPRTLSPDTAPGGSSTASRLGSFAGESGHAEATQAPDNGGAPVEQPTEQDGSQEGAHQCRGQEEAEHGADVPPSGPRPSIDVQAPTPEAYNQGARRRRPKKLRPKRQATIDILYENERGGFLCGTALFSSRALGGLDPPPWTNAYHKASPTSTLTAQVPDPSWEWIWPEWRINHQEGMDEDGWEYSFAFSKKFSWHGAKWWNSFVRRRAWIRKRAQKRTQDVSNDPHMLNTDYFTVRPASHPKRLSNGSSMGSRVASRSSMSQLSTTEAEERPDIEDMESLLRILRYARIDREKREVVENYLDHAIDLTELQDEMHEIMSLFVFQASRRQLLSHLIRKHDETMQELGTKGNKDKAGLRQRKKALDAAIKHAQEEVRRLAYWSDVKRMAEEGELRDSFDSEQGWFDANSGLDQSGPTAPRRKEESRG
ncbi:meiotically up-regulated 65 protein [Ophiocordyceps sinensis CO18]|uniref:Meiotically up-regulated 65 protein n=1 Tax=Ophiocordyceps sinensis (strain Co18 / CGMCC 3.14243) TaxID=911162 RepID=T5ANA9_OPHSC|nr:meiotically up-regulated 65 protein [Ophiocordyceps sinensis CO18]